MEGFGQFKKLMEESCIKLRDRLQIHSNNMTGREPHTTHNYYE